MSRGSRSATVTHDVFIGNLPLDANEKLITKHFNSFGEIQSLSVFNNKTGVGKISYVRYYIEADADSACRAKQGLEINGKKVLVRRAKKGGANSAGGVRKPSFGCSSEDGYNSPDIVSQSDMSDKRSAIGSDSDLSQPGDVNREEQVIVTHVESVISMWVQTITEQSAEGLRSMTKKLEQTCPAASQVKGTPVSGKHYATQYSQDGCWYRCTVKQVHSIKGKVKVLYVDFGNLEEKAVDDLVEIPQSLANVKPFAKKIVLHGLCVKNDTDAEAGLQFVQEKTEGRVLKARLTTPLRDNTGSFGDLYVEECSLSEMALQHGFVRRTMLPKKASAPRGQGTLNGSPQRITLNKNRSSQNELAEYKMLLEKEKAEKDMLSFELATLKGKFKSLQAEQPATTTRIVENTVEQKLMNIATLVQKVAQLRRQFPSDDSGNDCISSSLSIAMAADHISLESISSLGSVNEALEVYTSCQQAIKASKTLEGLADLIELRDKRRYDLHTSFRLFLDEASHVPLDDRMTKVKSVLQSISESYSGLIHFIINNELGLDEAKTLYSEWKAKVLTGFKEVRGQTDAVKQNLNTSLHHIQKLISLEDVGQSGSVNFDLDDMFKTYIAALQKEVAVTDVQHSDDACQMASIINKIKRAFEEELKIIESVKCLFVEFTRQKTAIEEWLNRKPDLQDFRDVRKNLRTMKNKLRHLLADKEDIDENDSGTDEERNRIEMELAALRCSLQRALLAEEELMMKYSTLAEDHFPEVKLYHADLNLDICQAYGGMLKLSRDIDHYHLEPASDQQGVYSVTFGDRPAVIKEYVVDDRIHASKEEFLQRALRYSRACSPYLSPIEAVFLSKNQKQAYVQTQASGISLLEFLEQEDLKPLRIQKILRCVTEGLCALHGAGLTHGALSPQSILITEDKIAQLVVPDLSRPEADPWRSWFVTNAGLEFKAPEEDASHPPSPSADLFHLGLLCLWMHVPHTKLSTSETGIPVITDLLISEDVRQVIRCLLLTQPSSRVTAQEVLQAEYFSNTIPDLLHVETQATRERESNSVNEVGVTSTGDHIGEASSPRDQAAEPVSGPNLSSELGLTPQPEDIVLEQNVCPPSGEIGSETLDTLGDTLLVSIAEEPENATASPVQIHEVVCESLSKMVSEFSSLNQSDIYPGTADKTLPTSPVQHNNDTSVKTSAAGGLMCGVQEMPIGTASLDPIMATAGAIAENLNLLRFDTPGNPACVQLPGGDTDNLLLESPNEEGEFTVNQNTMDTLTSMAAQVSPLDGSGDAKDSRGLTTSALSLDNATLMQNLLSVTTQHNTKSLGF